MALSDKIEATVQGYFDAFAARSVDAVLDLFADSCTVEDPVGSEPVSGCDAVRAFYERAMSMSPELTRLGNTRIAGHEAAFPFRGRVSLPDGRIEFEVIDVMTFDDDGRITSMRAFFGPTNIKPVAVMDA